MRNLETRAQRPNCAPTTNTVSRERGGFRQMGRIALDTDDPAKDVDIRNLRNPCAAACTALLGLSWITLGYGLATAAESSDGAGAAAASTSGVLEEIIVTATKRSESLQNVPLAISAVSGTSLTALGAVDLVGYARTIPGLSFTDLGTGREIITLRGLNASSGSATVSYYIDETPIPADVSNLARVQANPDLVDIDRIEVLRGPQGTLYGSSSMGGTIRLIPASPDLKQFGGWIDVGGTGAAGDSFGGNATAVVNVPIIQDTLGVRAALWYRDDDGFINRRWGPNTPNSPTEFQGTQWNIGSQTLTGGRLSLLYSPSDVLSITGLVYHDKRSANGFQDYTGGAINPTESLNQIMLANIQEPSETQFTLANITAKLTLGNIKLTSSSSYYRSRIAVNEEGTAVVQSIFGVFFPNELAEMHADSNYTEEVRVATVEPIHGLSVIAGVYYNRDADRDLIDYPAPGWNAQFAPGGPNDPSDLYAMNNSLFYDPEVRGSKETSEFGELSFALTNELKVTGGVRHYDVSNYTREISSGLFNGNEAIPVNVSGRYTGTLYKGNISYQVTDRDLVYATYSEGFRPGFGISALPAFCDASLAAIGLSKPPTQVNPDSVKNYELGAKTEWLDKRLAVNLSVYRIDWIGIQQSLFLPCGESFTSNVGRAVVHGAELEIPAQLTDHLGAGLSGSYTKATLSDSQPSFGALSGDQINNVPLWQAAAHSDYSFAATDTIRGVARVDVQYTGRSFAAYNRLPGTTERDPTDLLQGLLLVNTRLEFKRGDWSAAIFGNNLLDRISREGLQNSLVAQTPGRPRYVPNRPRTFGVNFRRQF